MAPFRFLLLFFLTTISASSASISNMFEFRRFSGRFLLQETEACPVDFEHKNYTALSRSCKEPNYQSDQCCFAFKELTCPYWDQLSDPKFNCASTLFRYINLYSNNSSDLVSDLCHKGEKGLDCGPILNASAPSAPTKSKSNSGAAVKCTLSSMLMITAGLLQLVFHLF